MDGPKMFSQGKRAFMKIVWKKNLPTMIFLKFSLDANCHTDNGVTLPIIWET